MRPYLACAVQQHNAIGRRLSLGVGQRIGLELLGIGADTVAGEVGIRPRLLTAALNVGFRPGFAASIGDGNYDGIPRLLESVSHCLTRNMKFHTSPVVGSS